MGDIIVQVEVNNMEEERGEEEEAGMYGGRRKWAYIHCFIVAYPLFSVSSFHGDFSAGTKGSGMSSQIKQPSLEAERMSGPVIL